MEIRHVKSSDNKNDISKIYEKSWKFAYEGIIPRDYLDGIPEGSWVPHLNNESVRNLVLVENGKIIGTSSYCASRSEEFKDFGEIVSIYFLPEYMGKGYGKKLFMATVNELVNLGYRKIFLWVLEDNIRARRFYERQNFKLSDKFDIINVGGKDLKEVAYIYEAE